MSFSDIPFPYGPFVPHHVPCQYLESYISLHQLDSLLVLNTTVEDVSKLPNSPTGDEKWKLTLRRYDCVRDVDEWWEEQFDAVILGNGHYSVPYIPKVKGLDEYLKLFPGKVVHSKTYRSPKIFVDKRILVIGNSASGRDISLEVVSSARLPVYQSRRSPAMWEGDEPPTGVEWKPIITEFHPNGRIVFQDGTFLDNIDKVIYCTGYIPSFHFWNEKANGRPLWSYEKNRILKGYQHTFFQDFKTLAIVGLQRSVSYRSWEYQAVALARLFSGRNSDPLPPVGEMERWELDREKERKEAGQKFHDVAWDTGETMEWLEVLYRIAGLRKLSGEGRTPPVMGADVRWALEHVRKYPDHGKAARDKGDGGVSHRVVDDEDEKEWVLVTGRSTVFRF